MFAYWDWSHYPKLMLDEQGIVAVPSLLSRLPQTVCLRRMLIGLRFPFCQHKHVGKVKGRGDKPKTLTGIKEPILCGHLI